MKKILILPLLLLSQYFFAQDVEVKWIDNNKGMPIDINAEGKYVYAVDALTVRCAEILGRIPWYNRISYVRTQNHLYADVTTFKEKENLMQRYYIEVNSKGEAIGNAKLVASDKYSHYMMEKPGSSGPDVDLLNKRTAISSDKKILLCITTSCSLDLNAPDKLFFTVYDEDLKVLWKKEQTFTEVDKYLLFNSVLVTNSGVVVLAANITKPGTINHSKELEQYQQVFVITKDSKKDIKIDLGSDGEANALAIAAIDDENIIVAGTYNKKTKAPTSSAGTYVGKISIASGTLVSKSVQPYSANSITQMGSAKENFIYNLNATQLLKTKTGDFVLLLNEHTQSMSVSSSGSTIHTTYFSKGNILVGFNKELKLTFETPVVNPFKTATFYSGTNAYVTGDNILLLSNYNVGNDFNHTFKYFLCNPSGQIIKNEEIPRVNYETCFFVPYPTTQFSDSKIAFSIAPTDANGAFSIYAIGLLTIK